MKNRKGFTLIEMLIATSIFAVVALTLYSAFNTGIFGYRNIEETINTFDTARQFLERFNLDLRNSFFYSDTETKFKGYKDSLSFLTIEDIFYEGQSRQDYAFVSYGLEGDKLKRLARRNKDALNKNSATKYEEIIAQVNDFNLSYGFITNPNEPLNWKDSWVDPVALPQAVKVSFKIESRNFKRTIFLPMSKI